MSVLYDFITEGEGVWVVTRSLLNLHENSCYKFGLLAFRSAIQVGFKDSINPSSLTFNFCVWNFFFAFITFVEFWRSQ